MKTRIIAAFALSIALSLTARAQVPGIINYQGRVAVGGTNFNGTGQFKLSLVNAAGTTTYWSNGNSAVSLTVTKGLYSVLLGDTGIANMSFAIPASVFNNSDVRLRVSFNDGVTGFQLLAPDQRLGAVGYAMVANSVDPASDVTGNRLKIGTGHTLTGFLATIAGGSGNTANNDETAVGGGTGNTASGYIATVGAGFVNTASGDYSFVGGGYDNTASGFGATVGGGGQNVATNGFATVPGGQLNIAGSGYSFAAGFRAKAIHTGAFVWGDSTAADFTSTGANQFLIRASGGVGISTAAPGRPLQIGDIGTSDSVGMIRLASRSGAGAAARVWDIGVPQIGGEDTSGTNYSFVIKDIASANAQPEFMIQWGTGNVGIGTNLPSAKLQVVKATCDGSSWINASDRNLKENFTTMDARAVLAKVAVLPITGWNYKEDAGTRHIGPMAQDFYAAFHVGPDDKRIATVDEGGVALAAIQGLYQELQAEKAHNAELQRRLTELEAKMEKVGEQVQQSKAIPAIVADIHQHGGE